MGSFCANQNEPSTDKNPVSKNGERATLLTATVVAGLGVGAKALFYLWDEGFEIDTLWNWGAKIVDRNNKDAKNKQLLYVGAFAALTVGFIGAVAAVYTLFKTPQIMYDGKVKAFAKGKDMDVYAKSNDVEKELYNQMLDKAKNASAEEKEVLKQQYLKLKAAKNPTPDFVQIETNKS